MSEVEYGICRWCFVVIDPESPIVKACGVSRCMVCKSLYINAVLPSEQCSRCGPSARLERVRVMRLPNLGSAFRYPEESKFASVGSIRRNPLGINRKSIDLDSAEPSIVVRNNGRKSMRICLKGLPEWIFSNADTLHKPIVLSPRQEKKIEFSTLMYRPMMDSSSIELHAEVDDTGEPESATTKPSVVTTSLFLRYKSNTWIGTLFLLCSILLLTFEAGQLFFFSVLSTKSFPVLSVSLASALLFYGAWFLRPGRVREFLDRSTFLENRPNWREELVQQYRVFVEKETATVTRLLVLPLFVIASFVIVVPLLLFFHMSGLASFGIVRLMFSAGYVFFFVRFISKSYDKELKALRKRGRPHDEG